MNIHPLYGRNLAITSVVFITDRKQFNRLVRREYSQLIKNEKITSRGKVLAELAMQRILTEHPEIWELQFISGTKNKRGVLCGFISDDSRAHIAEVLA